MFNDAACVKVSTCPTFCLIRYETVDFGHGTIEADDLETVVGSIEDEILTHDGQADEAEISTGFGRA